MIIDKLSYQSNLRYVNACEKTAFAVITLLLCVISRSIAIAVLVSAVMGGLTVGKGGTPLFRYLKLMTIPLAFLLMRTGRHSVKLVGGSFLWMRSRFLLAVTISPAAKLLCFLGSS